MRVFFDTNIMVYAYDERDPVKQKRARELINNNDGLISTQVIQEFCNVALVKIKNIDRLGLEGVLREVLNPILAHVPSTAFYTRAIQLFSDNSISFYDALIVQAALDLDCSILYSEDLQDGQKFGTLQVVNPFKK